MKISLWLIFELVLLTGLFVIFIQFTKNFNIVFVKRGSLEASENFTIDDVRNYISCYGDEKTEVHCTFPAEDFRLFYASGKSMQPYLEGRGEMLLCNNNFTLEIGSLYSYLNEELTNTSIVHRCMEMTETGCLFKGDSNNAYENITLDNILCKVEWLIRQVN